jgi:hypothetical protein
LNPTVGQKHLAIPLYLQSVGDVMISTELIGHFDHGGSEKMGCLRMIAESGTI